MLKFEPVTPYDESDATKATAHLPGLDIEVVHRRSPAGDAEQISIHLTAVPSFEAFGRFLESANPFAFWAQAAQLAWWPWLAAARATMLHSQGRVPARSSGRDDGDERTPAP